MAKAKRKSSTTKWILLRDALTLAIEHYGSADLAKELLLRQPKQYRALSCEGPVTGVSNFSDMIIDGAESSARPAYQMLVLPGGKFEPSRHLYRIELLRADVLNVLAAPSPRSARGARRQHDREAIRAVAADVLKGGVPRLKTTFYEDVRTECDKRRPPLSTPAPGNNRTWNEIVGDLYDAAIDSRRKGSIT